jgi:hypothetical protein
MHPVNKRKSINTTCHIKNLNEGKGGKAALSVVKEIVKFKAISVLDFKP